MPSWGWMKTTIERHLYHPAPFHLLLLLISSLHGFPKEKTGGRRHVEMWAVQFSCWKNGGSTIHPVPSSPP